MSGRWHKLFKSATYGPVVDASVDPSRTLLDPGELCAADLLANEVEHYLRQDARVMSVMGNRVDRAASVAAFDFRKFPRCLVYTTGSVNSERPTATSVEQVTVYVGTLWDEATMEVLEAGQVSVATPLAHFKRVLRAQVNRQLVVWFNGRQVGLARDVRLEPERFVPVELAGVKGYINELPAVYTVHVDRSGPMTSLL